MKAIERRMAILETLCERKFDKVENLAFEFNVSEWTIRQDILELSLSYPIYTKTGKYGGGVYIAEDYKLGKKYLTDAEAEFLERLLPELADDDASKMQAIIKKFKQPRRGKK